MGSEETSELNQHKYETEGLCEGRSKFLETICVIARDGKEISPLPPMVVAERESLYITSSGVISILNY